MIENFSSHVIAPLNVFFRIILVNTVNTKKTTYTIKTPLSQMLLLH